MRTKKTNWDHFLARQLRDRRFREEFEKETARLEVGIQVAKLRERRGLSQTQLAALMDLDKVPLYFASDITVGTTSLFADYIFPDLHYLERWEFQGSHPNMPVKVQPVRQPVIASPNEVVKVFGEEQPISIETVWLALAEKLGLPGFGKDAFGPGKDLARPDDFYLRFVANLAHDGKESVPDASAEDMQIFQKSRRHLPRNVFDPARWAAICGESWKKAVFVLTRGGRFDTQENSYKGDQVAKMGTPIEASGQLLDGTKVDGIVTLRQALLRQPEIFVGTVVEKLMIYALGRGLSANDMPTVRAIVQESAGSNYRFSSLVMGIVKSTPFQKRVTPASEAPPALRAAAK